ncbi:hypothetical protein N8I77_007477 [Diaporthe amygdali]|uniref:Nephrocystin 3-like N-terminal domain-containing protein n=1 Tax=Phomopsis amygdali TaxID=1214568 RepID=A0AAD9SBB6_PHOAM|nr:hypothetical protein N8I77_007477 [Diaporthe amygdali]
MDLLIRDTGVTVIHEPDSGFPLADIVLIHGLQGHPYKTWACKPSHRGIPSTAASSAETSKDGNGSRKSYHRIVPQFSGRFSDLSSVQSNPSQKSRDGKGVKEAQVFWPKDLLPAQCQNARILVYGYDTKVTKYLFESTNENSIHSHSKDLLSSLAAHRKPNRPLILIAHSLGGIIVKEMLASSSNSTEDRLENVVASTAAVIFLGTPHRGSPDLATVGDRARSMVSALRMRTNSTILDALRLKTKDLERAQESFSTVWRRYDFRVKTFQEGLGLTGLNFGPFGRKVVPDFSSLLGDVRERAETIQANHMDMCRFTGIDDPNYSRICGELGLIYDSLAGLNVTTANRGDSQSLTANTLATSSQQSKAEDMSEHERICLSSLLFPNMNQRTHNLEDPAEGTCSWFFRHGAFTDWLSHKNQTQACGLLWLRGKPGSGKSTLLKEACLRATMEKSGPKCHVAAFFFNAKGNDLEHSPTGMLRSILHQMCSRNASVLKALLSFAQSRLALCGEDVAPWDEAELRAFFKSAIVVQKARMIIFIDAIDECDSGSVRDVADFWRESTKAAHCAGVQLSVCLSSRHYPAVSVNDCPEIIMENHNHADIIQFVGRRLNLGMTGNLEDQQAIQKRIVEKSGGVFLWVSLVIRDILRKSDEGRGLTSLLKHLESVPRELEDLFSQLLTAGPYSAMTVRMFQWALLPTKPLRLHEWHHILAFIGDAPPSSLHQWRKSDLYTENDEQLEKRITHLSRGLLGFNVNFGKGHEPADESTSDRAGAGSLDLNTGETRVVQVVHESVRQYFIDGPGFAVLNTAFAEKPLAYAHLSIMSVCLDYILISELDALIDARKQTQRPTRNQQAEAESEERHNTRRGSSISPESYPHELYWSLPDASGILRGPDTIRTMYQSRTPARPQSPASVASFGSASSHDGSWTTVKVEMLRDTGKEKGSPGNRKRSRLNESPSPTPHTRRKLDDSLPVHHGLKESSGPAESYDIAGWSEALDITNEGCYDEHAAHESPQASVTGCSQVLEDYPALLSYAIFELFTHAQKADVEDPNPISIIRRMSRDGIWSRWKALREDIDGRTGLLYFAADLGLSSWLKVQGGWEENEVRFTIELAIANENARVFERVLDAFPSAGYARDAGWILTLACLPDAALLQAYLSRHPAHKKGSVNSIAAMKSILASKDQDGRTALHHAVIHHNIDGVSVLLRHGASISDVDPMFWTPLHVACMNTGSANRSSSDKPTSDGILAPRSDIIELLLENHAQIDAVDAKGRTPLILACSNSSLPPRRDMCESLPSSGAECDGVAFNAVDMLLKHGADATIRSSRGLLPLHEACWTSLGGRQSKVSIVSKLLDQGSPVNAMGPVVGSPLHVACVRSDVQIVEELLGRGANSMLPDHDGCSPLQIAAIWSNEQVVEALLSFPGTSVDVTDTNGSTALHMACDLRRNTFQNENTKLSKIRRLLAHGAKAYTLRNHNGDSPANIARRCSFEEAHKLLARESCDAPHPIIIRTGPPT